MAEARKVTQSEVESVDTFFQDRIWAAEREKDGDMTPARAAKFVQEALDTVNNDLKVDPSQAPQQ
jgi:hypothetical protein